jgi:hypothetical protein
MTEREELEARIKKAREDRAAFDRQREEREELAALRRQAAREENALRDAPHIAKMEEEHGPIGEKIAVVETDLGAIVVKRPTQLHYRRFQNKSSMSTDEVWALVKPCIVYPTIKEAEAILEELPGTLMPGLSDAVIGLAGHRTKEVEKK